MDVKVCLISLFVICMRVKPAKSDTLIVPIGDTDEAWEITSYGSRVVNTWRSNYDMCVSRGAMLLEVHNSYMTEQVKKFAGDKGVWLGLLLDSDRQYFWASGTDLDYTNWAQGYPMTGSSSFYAVLTPDGLWRTTRGNADLTAVCMRRITRPRASVGEATREDKQDYRDVADRGVVEGDQENSSDTEYKPQIYLDGIILHVGEEPTDWLTAYYYCKKKDLTLAVILTPEFNSKLTAVARQLRQPLWMSLVGAGGRFWWMNGVQFEYSELSPDYDLTGRDSTYTLLKEDGKWHDSCPGGREPCQEGVPLCVEIAPQSTGRPQMGQQRETTTYFTAPTTTIVYETVENMVPTEATVSENVLSDNVEEEESGPCFDAVRESQVRQTFSGLRMVFVPTCNQDGTFTALQCGEQTCWCVSEDGGLIPESIDPSRELTQEQCLIHRGTLLQGDNDIEGAAPTALCVVAARVYDLGEQFKQGCNTCTCRGRNTINCSPTTECQQEELFCRYWDKFDFTCSTCSCDGPQYSSFTCLTYDRYCGEQMSDEDNQIWFAYTQSTELAPPTPELENLENKIEEKFEVISPATLPPTSTEIRRITEDLEKQYKITLFMAEKESTWIDAYYDCQGMGMSLPTDLNEVLNTYLQNYLRQHMVETWLNAEQSNGYAYWFSGTLMDYTNWAPYSDPEYNYGRGYVTLSYDGMWYTKTDYDKSQYYCIKMEEVSTRAVKLGYKGTCLIGDVEYYKGQTFGPTCNRCTCYLYSTVYVDCVRRAGCKHVTTPAPPPPTTAPPAPAKLRVKSKCHGGVRFLDCSSPCERECESRDSCRRHCTQECSCPIERPVFYGGCCVGEAVCIDDGWETWA
ncbi:hypothetical protein ACHWQZ_G001504 [Mnemiopsis leidyi]